jgi:hypothetical protein
MKTTIANKLDYLANSDRLTESKIWDLIDQLFDKPSDVTDTINYFIRNLPQTHQVPAKEWEKLIMIAQWVDEHNQATDKQKRAVGVILALYWNEQIPFDY